MLEFIHLMLYPFAFGVLSTLTVIGVAKRKRWLLIVGPLMTAVAVLAIETHVNYLGYLAY